MSNVDVKRLVENIRSGTNIYAPPVELVVNAIQAIDTKGIQNGLVEIEVLRNGQADMIDRLDEARKAAPTFVFCDDIAGECQGSCRSYFVIDLLYSRPPAPASWG
jgi:hypothetical protein